MSEHGRRIPPQKAIDDPRFRCGSRCRCRTRLREFAALHVPLARGRVGRGNYAQHATATTVADAAAWYFREVDDARAFVAAFPALVLADGTDYPIYQSPHLPFGRGAEWNDPVCNL